MTYSTYIRSASRARHASALQQQPRRGFDWHQQQQASSEFQPVVVASRRYGEDNEPDKDGHPRMAARRSPARQEQPC